MFPRGRVPRTGRLGHFRLHPPPGRSEINGSHRRVKIIKRRPRRESNYTEAVVRAPPFFFFKLIHRGTKKGSFQTFFLFFINSSQENVKVETFSDGKD